MAGEYAVTVAVPSMAPLRAVLRRIAGADEAALAPGRPGEPTRLLAALSRAQDGGPLDLASLPVTLHDRLLAEVFRTEVGERATCRAGCVECEKPFEFELVLADLLAAQDQDAAACAPAGEDGRWLVAGARVRAPTLADAARGPLAGAAALCEERLDAAALAEVAAFLERVCPLLALDLDAVCPHCGAAQPLGFDLPRFLVRSLANDRPFMVRETHLIAARYGWSHAEIMGLPREDRRAYAGLIESERSAALRARVAA